MGDLVVQPQLTAGYAWTKRFKLDGDQTHHNAHFGVGLGLQKGLLNMGLEMQALVKGIEGVGGGFFGGLAGRYGGLRVHGGVFRLIDDGSLLRETAVGAYAQLGLHLSIPYTTGGVRTQLQFFISSMLFISKNLMVGVTAGLRVSFDWNKKRAAAAAAARKKATPRS
jgi:hypothetical protein